MKIVRHEPVQGLPPGERILWQGAPHWRYLARHTFKSRAVAIYLWVLVALRAVLIGADTGSIVSAIVAALWVAPLAIVGWGVLVIMAWAHARTTQYTLTERRWVFRFGVALQLTVNLPFKATVSADFLERSGGFGDLPIRVVGETGPSYFHLWPHARPWHINYPQPMARGIPEVRDVAKLFAEALISFREGEEAGKAEATSPPTHVEDDRGHASQPHAFTSLGAVG